MTSGGAAGASRDRDPRDEIVDHLGARRAFALSLTRHSERADDLVQDTVVKAWTRIDQFQPGTNMRAWLYTILRNIFYSERRRAWRDVQDSDGALAETLSEKPAHDGRLALADFRVAFDRLPDEQREALMLVGAQGFSYDEAAEMCGCKIGTIKSRTNRAREKLAELLHLSEGDSLELTDQATVAVVGRSGGTAG
jgi:RNA polymerase sigma-70 factor (ECF subfamily)